EAWRRQQHDRLYVLVSCRGDQCDGAALAMADDGDAFRVDVLAIGKVLHGGAHVFGVVAEPGGFRAAAALPDAALVVPDDHEARIGKRAGELAEHRNPE